MDLIFNAELKEVVIKQKPYKKLKKDELDY